MADEWTTCEACGLEYMGGRIGAGLAVANLWTWWRR